MEKTSYYFAHFAGKLISNTLLVDVKTVAFTEVKESLGSLRPTEITQVTQFMESRARNVLIAKT